MSDREARHTGATFIDAPRDADLVALHAYWLSKRGPRSMPSRADIDPAEFHSLLPHIIMYDVIMYDVGPDHRFRIRLAGEANVEFVGQNLTGQGAGARMDPQAAANMSMILRTVVDGARGSVRARRTDFVRRRIATSRRASCSSRPTIAPSTSSSVA
jgi:hypothetical protein